MEFPEQDLREISVENSFVMFLITISKLSLSKEATCMLKTPKAGELHYFLLRNRRLMKSYRTPKGVLIL